MILTLRENPCVKGVHRLFQPRKLRGCIGCCRTVRVAAIFCWEESGMETRVAVISIIVESPDMVQTLNGLLHDYSEFIIGRMGIPYPKRGVSIITVALDAPQNTISTLSGKLGGLSGVSVKTAYSSVTGKNE